MCRFRPSPLPWLATWLKIRKSPATNMGWKMGYESQTYHQHYGCLPVWKTRVKPLMLTSFAPEKTIILGNAQHWHAQMAEKGGFDEIWFWRISWESGTVATVTSFLWQPSYCVHHTVKPRMKPDLGMDWCTRLWPNMSPCHPAARHILPESLPPLWQVPRWGEYHWGNPRAKLGCHQVMASKLWGIPVMGKSDWSAVGWVFSDFLSPCLGQIHGTSSTGWKLDGLQVSGDLHR